MRVASQTIAAQELQVVELLTHALSGLGRIVAAPDKELSDHLGAAVTILVQIDFLVLHAEDTEISRAVADAHFRQDIVHQVGMQGIARRQMANVLV